MAASSSSSHSAADSSSRSYKYDVFLSFRGEDTRKTFVDHLYSALVDRQICTYKDDQTLPRGEPIRLNLFKAIEESQIAIIVFSKNYVGSSWCLDELAHIMKCKEERKLIVMPIFYDVEPSDVRNPKREFEEAFAKQEAKNVDKAKLWRDSLVDVSNIAGWEIKNNANGYESIVIKEIIDTISNRLYPINSDVDEDLIGMMTRLNDLESLLDIGSNGVRMVGIWGIGGSGKTTLAFSLYKKISSHFHGHCIIDNIQVESNKHGLKHLQGKILKSVQKTYQWVQSVEEGKDMIKSRLCKSNVLIILDDVNNLEQLQALAGSHKWFGNGSRIIITTRDEHLLRAHKVDLVYPVRLLLDNEAILLFNRHAYNEKDPVKDYDKLSLRMFSYAKGLPLALKVLGSFLYDKDENEWISALDKLKDIPDPQITSILKISYDGLETYQKELFLDIVCFWRWKDIDDAMEILEACDFYPKIGIKVLRQKSLLSIVDGRFDMHDLIYEMGLYIVRGEHPKNPEKHSRVWKDDEIKNMCYGDVTMVYHNLEAIRFENYVVRYNRRLLIPFYNIISNMKRLRCLMVRFKKQRWLQSGKRKRNQEDEEVDEYYKGCHFLSNELRYFDWDKYPARSPFPDTFQPVKLVVLKLSSKQEELWKGYKHLPHLKVLELFDMRKLLNTPDFDGLPCLQKFKLHCCNRLEEIHSSFRNHTSLECLTILGCYKLRKIPRIVQMKNLKTLEIKACHLKDGELPYGIGELSNLQELDLSRNHFSRLDINISKLTQLKLLNVSYCDQLVELPELSSSLAILKADYCYSLTTIGDSNKNCKWLHEVSLINDGVSLISDGRILLQSMLEGKTIENHFMILRLEGFDVVKEFKPPLIRGCKYILEVPDNWCNEFSGFLMCLILPHYYSYISVRITNIKQMMSELDSHDDVLWKESDCLDDVIWEVSDSLDDVLWEESDSDKYTKVGYVSSGLLRQNAWWDQTYKAPQSNIQVDKYTLMWYVPFASLRHTTWWGDHTFKALSFDVEDKACSGFGVRLVEKKCRDDLTSRSTSTSTSTSHSHHASTFKIENDQEFTLKMSLSFHIRGSY